MGLSLLAPAALSALAALLLPLLIHLARRSELHPTDFSALRWLRAQLRPRRRLRFENWPLLLLRLLLLTLLAIWLAQPVLNSAPNRTPYVAVMPGVTGAAIESQTLPADARRHWLAVGLPPLAAPAPVTPQPIDSLLRQIDAELPEGAPLIVLATAQFDGADAQLPKLSRHVDWRIVAGEPPSLSPTTSPPPRLRIYADIAHAAELRYLRAAASAWHADDAGYTLHGIDEALPGATNEIIVRLGEGTLPPALLQWIENGGTTLVDADASLPADTNVIPLWRDDAGGILAEGHTPGRGRLLRFTRPLQPQSMPMLLDADFPQRLLDLLQPIEQPPTRVDARSRAPVTGGRAHSQAARDLQPWIALLIALVFVIERWLATRAQRGVTA